MKQSTEEELKAAMATRKKRSTCSECGASRNRSRMMGGFNNQIIEFLEDNNITKRDSCINCVEKHFGYARELYKELLTLKQSATQVRGSVELNHVEVIGELRAATAESSEYELLYQELLSSERNYRYEGIEPDWIKIAGLIEDVKNTNGKK